MKAKTQHYDQKSSASIFYRDTVYLAMTNEHTQCVQGSSYV